MSRTCTVCSNNQKLAIESSIAAGTSYRDIAGQFETTKSSIERHVKSCIPAALDALRKAQKVESALVVEDEVKHVFNRLNKLIDACDEWLTDPKDTSKYTLEPRDLEIQVVYFDYNDADNNGNPRRKRDSLGSLVKRAEAANIEVVSCFSKHADPRELVVKTAGQIASHLQLYAKLRGLFQKPRDNDDQREHDAKIAKLVRAEVDRLIKQEGWDEKEARAIVLEANPEAGRWIN